MLEEKEEEDERVFNFTWKGKYVQASKVASHKIIETFKVFVRNKKYRIF